MFKKHTDTPVKNKVQASSSNAGKSKTPSPFDKQAPVVGVKHIVAVGSGKGGVGKSTVAVNLALALKMRGARVGLLDADLYGPSLPRMMGCLQQKPDIDPSDHKIYPLSRYGLKIMSMGFLVEEEAPVIWRGPMLFKAVDQFLKDVKWGVLDYLIVDLPPGTGDVVLTLAQKTSVSGGIVVCTPQNIALVDAKKALNMLEQLNIPCLGVVENMSVFKRDESDEPIHLFPKGQLDTYLKVNNIKKLVSIPFYTNLGLSCEAGVPFLESYGEEEGQVFLKLADLLQQQLPIKD